MSKIICYYCNKPFKANEESTVAQKWFDDGGQVWEGKRVYPKGLSHIKCNTSYERIRKSQKSQK